DTPGQQLFPSITRVCSARVEQGPRHNIIWRVPADDTHTLNLLLTFWPDGTPVGPLPVRWKDNKPGEYDHADDDWWEVESMDQDRMAVEGQGLITDRSTEHLAASDRGVTLDRELRREAIKAVEQRRDRINVFRDPADDGIVEFNTHMFGFTPPLRPLAGVSSSVAIPTVSLRLTVGVQVPFGVRCEPGAHTGYGQALL